jgi:MFS superfamily sulfate permease-like transporter
MRRQPWHLVVLRDFTAGLIVAMVAIPLAMGFAIASGLNPVHGIVGGAIAGFAGALFGGSKYQVYGPTAAFIPVIFGVMAKYGADDYSQGYGMLILCSVIAGVILMLMGVGGLGRLVSKVPHSIVVGFTIGIALTIAVTQIGDVLGYKSAIKGDFLSKLQGIWEYRDQFNAWALVLAIGTFFVTKYLLKISPYIPGPLIAIGVGYVITTTLLASQGLTQVQEKFGRIPTDEFLAVTLPFLPALTLAVLFDIAFYVTAIVFVAAIESLLCSRMADRLADNQGTPYNPDKELWGQGLVNVAVPLLNGFPHTGALARTATNIKLGAITPLAGIFKGGLKLLLAFYLATYLNLVPMACIGGILAYVAFNMVKPSEVRQVLAHNSFHVGLMLWTAGVVFVTDFLTGVLSAIVLYALLSRFLDRPAAHLGEQGPTTPEPQAASAEGDTSRRQDAPTAA